MAFQPDPNQLSIPSSRYESGRALFFWAICSTSRPRLLASFSRLMTTRCFPMAKFLHLTYIYQTMQDNVA